MSITKEEAQEEAFKVGKYRFDDYHKYEIEDNNHKGTERWNDARQLLVEIARDCSYDDPEYGADELEEYLYNGIDEGVHDGPFSEPKGSTIGFTYDGTAYCCDCAKEGGLCDDEYEPNDLMDKPPRGFNVGRIHVDEWVDAPGNSCTVCLEYLPHKNLIHY
jgi:hypothetical protein